jgi:polar amino acid transport system substrate-binding protein
MKKIIIFIVVVAAIFVVIKLSKNDSGENAKAEELRIGYIVYPPLLTKDPITGDLSGVSYDLVEATADELGLETNWVEEVGWGTALEGLNTKRYDILGTQMWPNEARAQVAAFSVAPMDSVLFPYVRASETRFSGDNLSALNSEEVKISAVDGELAVFIAQEDYPKAQLKTLSQLSSYAEVFLGVVQKKADVAFTEPSAAEDFLKSQPGTIKRLGDIPVRSFGNSFAFDKENTELLNRWNKALVKVMNEGTTKEILEKYKVATHYSVN